MRPVILYRDPCDISFDQELETMRRYFYCTNSRVDIQKGDLVIPRYSSLPYYEEQERDINKAGAKLINSYRQHEYIADMNNYYWDIEDLTPKTWFRPYDVPINEKGAFVLKGKTNSKKFLWDTHMFAEDRNKVMEIYCKLQDDTLIGCQDIYIRKFIPLYNYAVGIRGLPISKEFRFFIAYKQILCGAFYWSNFAEDIAEKFGLVPCADVVPGKLIFDIIERVGDNSNFYTIDVAQTAEGEWIVIELNCGTMSGLSNNCPNILYYMLKEVIEKAHD
jgi:hypothetical protein